MLKSFFSALSHQNPFTLTIEKTLQPLCILLSLGLTFGSLGTGAAQAQQREDFSPDTPRFTPAEDVFLFGSSPQRQQLGQVYMVVKVKGNRVVGAMFQPFSVFDCFRGVVKQNQLVLNLTESYTQDTQTYSLNLTDALVASTNRPTSDNILQLEGLYPISEVNENDLRILNTCEANYAQVN